MQFNITGYSTALFSTWFFIEELGILFDAGDGVISGLMGKSGKIKHVFVSHADRDHVAGLIQLNQINARDGYPMIHYPKDSGSFPAIRDFTKKFDPHAMGTVWNPIDSTSIVSIKNDIQVEAFRNNHIDTKPNISKSLSFKVFRTKRKLKSEYQNLKGQEIGALTKKYGQDHTTNVVKTNLINYSGDTPVDNYELWHNSNILIHEATFLGGNEDRNLNPHGNQHSQLEEVIRMVSEIKIETLILSHFSSRYTINQIDEQIKKLCKEYNIKIPVFRIKPGYVHRNILTGVPLN